MNGKFDTAHPDEVIRKGDKYALYDDMEQIIHNSNGGKIVINLCADDLGKEYNRIKDLDGNTIQITGNYIKDKNI